MVAGEPLSSAVSGSDDRFVLAIDLGSGALKVGAVTIAGEVGAVSEAEIGTERPGPGAAVQDAAGWWEMVREHSRKVLMGIPADRVVAVSCTGQWASTVPVDGDGIPVGPCVTWLDTRGARHSREVVGGPLMGYAPGAIAAWIRRSGGIPSPHGGDPVSHMLLIEREQPEVAAATRWYMEPVDYLTMRFTGRAAATHASMSAAWLTDNRHLDRLEYDSALVQRAGLLPEKLPPLVETGSIVGGVLPGVAAELGIDPGARVVTGSPDLHSAAVGTGAIREGEPHMTISTTSWISLPFPKKKTDAIRSIATVPGLDSRSYLVANNHEAAGLCLRWLRGALHTGEPADFERLVELAETAPPGSGGVIFTPWIAGERSPVDDRNARGGFHNLSASTTNAELIRAVLEGVAYNSRWLNKAVERFAGIRLDPIRIFGGGAIPDLWCQIHADVMERTIERVAHPLHTNIRGAALLAALALGAVDRGEVRALVPVDRVFHPDPAVKEAYDRLYAEFPGLYKAQRKMFARLNG
ncbi:MAG TPA: FGGY-family carbohydrate kinase [Solirubrobacterales bacterium]|nr:FGGY-family carbohydrate kinase [Solirubrobacterales bacterium]